MTLQKVILYYGFAPVADPAAVVLWQRTLCDSLGLKGRILVSPHGINGTVGGEMEAVKKYVRATKQYPGFGKIDFKWSEGVGDEFPRLSVKARKELVAFTTPDDVTVGIDGVENGGVHLKPAEVNKLVEERGDDVVFFDGRNAFEARIGKFKNAIVPDVRTSHDFITEIESGKYDHLKSKPIVTYCTGGVRCEILSAVMLNRGFTEVYQIEGGIVRYGEKFKDKGLWEGSLYIFDKRMVMNFSHDAATIGECDHCGGGTSSFYNCHNPECRHLALVCDECAQQPESFDCAGDHAGANLRGEVG
ncbi:MAG: hypothetical protein RIS25_69 [Actinomycetota bacterium]|jgi:UPF0176 protein